MIRVCEEALKEFRQIYKTEFGVDLVEGEATELSSGLLNLFALLNENKGDYNENEKQGRKVCQLDSNSRK